MIDTLKLAKRLQQANLSAEQSEVIAEASIEFLAVRQLFGEHDLADLLFSGHGSILFELRLSRQIF